MHTEPIGRLQERREEARRELAGLEEFRLGSLFFRRRRCGKAGCRCGRPGDPGHGHWLISRRENGRTRMTPVPEARLAEVRRQIEAGRRFWALCGEWARLTDEIARRRWATDASPEAAEKGGSGRPAKPRPPRRSNRS